MSIHMSVNFWRGALLTLSLACTAQAQSPAPAAKILNPMQLTAHHITASVRDMDRAVKWYQQVLGFTLDQRGERPNGMKFAELKIPGFGVALVQMPGAAAATGPAAGSQVPAWVHIVFTVPDPVRAYRELKSRGADVYTRGTVELTRTFLMHDSEGNEIEIVAAEAGDK